MIHYPQGVNGTADYWEVVESASKADSGCCQGQIDTVRGSEIEVIGGHTESPDQKCVIPDTVPECVQLVQLYTRKLKGSLPPKILVPLQ